MASFLLPSSIQKRLLRYALSRLEILDTDALDLEHLDISWGTKSTLEFRDVGLRLKKLSTILQLPPNFDLVKARIVLLRVTIPVDIYSSPIVVQVDGVEGRLQILSELDGGQKKSSIHTNHDRKQKGLDGKGKSIRDDDQSGQDDDGESALPTAVDLAESFLQTEPLEERAELEAAIVSQPQVLHDSIYSDDEEDDSPVGTGTGLTLPSFMANFLKGIVDRLQVRIRGISLNVGIELPNDFGARSEVSSSFETVSLEVKVDDVDIEGVTTGIDDTSEGGNKGKAFHSMARKDGKRRINLRTLQGTLISDASVFANLARSSGTSSPSTTHSDLRESGKDHHKAFSNPKSSVIDLDGPPPLIQTLATPRLSERPDVPSSAPQPSNPPSLYNSHVVSDSGRFEDALEDEDLEDNPHQNLTESSNDIENSSFDHSAYLDQVTESQFMDYENDNEDDVPIALNRVHRPVVSGIKSPLSTPRASIYLPPPSDSQYHSVSPASPLQKGLQSTFLPSRPRPNFMERPASRSQPLPTKTDGLSEWPVPGSPDKHNEEQIGDESGGSSSSSSSTPSGEDALAQSQLFSHEDAESMYMSALSQNSMSARLPGGWESSGGGTETLDSAHRSPISLLSSRNESPDNLERARQAASESLHESIMSQEYRVTSNMIEDTAQNKSTLMGKLQHGHDEKLALSGSISAYDQLDSEENSDSIRRNIPLRSVSTMKSTMSTSSTQSSEVVQSYTKVAKQLFHLDQVAIFLPPTTEAVEPHVDLLAQSTLPSSTFNGHSDLSQSVTPHLPGAFSVHSARVRRHPPRIDATIRKPTPNPREDEPNSVEIVMGKLETQFDISVGRLVAKLIYSISESIGKTMPTTTSDKPKEDSPVSRFSLQFKAERISLKFLEKLASVVVSANSNGNGTPWVKPPSSDVLLRTTLKGLDIKHDASQARTTTDITLQKYLFGYAKENILSFDAGLRMSQSTRDLASSAGVDLSINITRSKDTIRYKIETLPVHVSIDLQKLDETFSWFGGLSSVLNMGSSMASNATMTATNQAKTISKPRGVRFDTPIKPDDESVVAQNKVNARIGGFVLDLVGKECSVGMDTTAVKIVGREEGIGMSVDKVRISGPHLSRSQGDPAIIAEITGTRIEFLDTPKDVDLDRLLSLITPSKAKYDRDDDILLETLLRQRRQGAVLRITVDNVKTRVSKLNELNHLPELGEELAKLSTVTKYLPEDDRPGLLSLLLVRDVDVQVDVNETLGSFQFHAGDIEVAQITLPSLVALSVKTINVHRNSEEELLGVASDTEKRGVKSRLPAIMARMIGDEMEPVVKIKLRNLRVEYRVRFLMEVLGLSDNATTEEMASSIAASVATLTDRRPPRTTTGEPKAKDLRISESKPMMVDIGIQDCILGLNPLSLPSKVLVVMTDAHISVILPKDNNSSSTAEMSKGAILVIDDVSNISLEATVNKREKSFDGGSSQVADLCAAGFVTVSYISSAKAVIQVHGSKYLNEKCIDVELRDDLLIIESCADSTQTLIAALNGLKPPVKPSKELKYRTKVIPVRDMLASISGDAFGTAEGNYDFDEDFGPGFATTSKPADDDENSDLDFDSHYYENEDSIQSYEDVDGGSRQGSVLFDQDLGHDTNEGVLLESFTENQVAHVEELNFQEDHFGTGSILEGTAHRWNSARNTYDRSNEYKVRESPLKVCVRDVHIIWNLFDGYDWAHTRDTITKAVQDVETKAMEKRARNNQLPTFDQDIDDGESVIDDFLFNSIYIGIPANRDPRELALVINQELNDNATETESVATTVHSGSTLRPGAPSRQRGKKLRLNRSKHHKITFELKGVNLDLVAFPPGSGETESSIDVRVRDFDIFDHVPTSTWRKFATYMQDAGERETGTSQIHIEVLNVKPVPELAASEMVLKATVLPLRLHVDQDALDFITRFFEFKDDSGPTNSAPGEVPFIQRAEINSVVVKLDFKPKRVDYAGLRSGHTTEFMNFLILDEADMVLRHTIIYGISGFDKLGKCLNDIWMPDIKRNQLPGILAGLAPVRSLANVGGGVRDLYVIPMREYRKDGRVVRSISKGAAAFARTTGTELVKLGAKLAIGTQTVLQGAEQILTLPQQVQGSGWDDSDLDEEEKRVISLYADQPIGVAQGLRIAGGSLKRDLLMARDAIIAVPGEVMESGTAQGAAKAILRRAPTVILRPAIGASKAISQALMGATNSLDPQNRRRVEDKYKKH